MNMEIIYSKVLESVDFQEIVQRTREVLQRNHFGILSEIDVSATLKKKMNVDFDEYCILGACNPPFAYDVLSKDKDFGVFLPCNVVVYRNDKQTICVGAVNPFAALKAIDKSSIENVATNIRGMLQKVIDEI